MASDNFQVPVTTLSYRAVLSSPIIIKQNTRMRHSEIWTVFASLALDNNDITVSEVEKN